MRLKNVIIMSSILLKNISFPKFGACDLGREEAFSVHLFPVNRLINNPATQAR